MSHIDDEAKKKIMRLEWDVLAMKKLEDFYRDEEKVIDASMEEINQHPHMVEKDNVGLVSLKTFILNN